MLVTHFAARACHGATQNPNLLKANATSPYPRGSYCTLSGKLVRTYRSQSTPFLLHAVAYPIHYTRPALLSILIASEKDSIRSDLFGFLLSGSAPIFLLRALLPLATLVWHPGPRINDRCEYGQGTSCVRRSMYPGELVLAI